MARKQYDVKVNLSPVADGFSGPMERIVEFSSAAGGGLISFVLDGEGHLIVEVYREDETVQVRTADRHHTAKGGKR